MQRKGSLSLRTILMVTVAISAGGCNFLENLSEVGEAPRVSRIEDPTQTTDYKPISMPMPAPTAQQPAGPNSLWRSGAREFFKDQRAAQVGDVVTVNVNINDSGQLTDKTQTSTQSSESLAAPNFLGFAGNNMSRYLAGANFNSLVNIGSSGGINGQGTMTRQEQVVINLAATVMQRLPNGNLVISGKQELRVNGDMRELSVQGIIRPEDVSTTNTIDSSQIAEARLTYGGRGTLADIQQPRYGQQIFDLVAPF